MDAADRAQQEVDAELAGHLREQTRRAGLDRPGGDNCAECGDPIPPERRRALPSAHRCVNCQAFVERIGKIQPPHRA